MQDRVRSPVASPRYSLKNNGDPDVEEILKEAEKYGREVNSGRSSSREVVKAQPRSYSPTPVGSSVASPRPILRSGGAASQKRTIPRPQTVSPDRSELLRAQRDTQRKIQRDEFEETVVKEYVKPSLVHAQKTGDTKIATKRSPVSSTRHQLEQIIIDNEVKEIIGKQLGIQNTQIVQVPKGFVAHKTSGGIFITPDYENMTPTERSHEKIILFDKFKSLKERWEPMGFKFGLPAEDESLSAMEIRRQQYVKAIKKKRGTNLWWWVLAFVWGGIEYGLCKWVNLKADGVAFTQLKNYKIYEANMIELGEGSGFGEDWPPWIQTAVTTALSVAAFVFISTVTSDSEKGCKYSSEIMTQISGILTGKEVVEMDEDGNPVAPKEGILDKLGKMDFENMSIMKGISLFKMFTGGGSGKKSKDSASGKEKTASGKKTKEEIAKEKAERRKKAEADD